MTNKNDELKDLMIKAGLFFDKETNESCFLPSQFPSCSGMCESCVNGGRG